MKRALFRLVSIAIAAATRALPTRRHVIVTGTPSLEGNAVETVRELLRSYPGHVYWLDGPSARDREWLDVRGERLDVLPKWSGAAILRYITAEAIFYTHGIYGNPRLDPRRAVINLWHGDGMKRVPYAGYATHLVSGTRMYGAVKAQWFRLRPDQVILTGNPRIDQFGTSAPEKSLEALGLDFSKPFVVWLPTYRESKPVLGAGLGGRVVDVAEDTAGPQSLATLMAEGIEELRRQGITVIVKPHPMDAVSRDVPGAVYVDDAGLSQAQLSLYTLLAASSGLISDYSSVWVEYLLLDKPIGFFVPDREIYEKDRGVTPPDVFSWIPGKELADVASFRAFGDEILHNPRADASLRASACEIMGVVDTKSAAEDLIKHLTASGHLSAYNQV